jgi:hypothetical protein
MPPKKGPSSSGSAKSPAAGKNKSTIRGASKATGTGAGKFGVVDLYLKTVPAWPAKVELLPHFHKVVDALCAAAQAEAKALGHGLKAEYEMRYGRPTIRYGGRNTVLVALFKEHIALMGVTFHTHAEIAPLLAKYYENGLTTTKGCVKFSRKMLNESGVPVDVVKAYGKLGVQEAQAVLDSSQRPAKKPSSAATNVGTKATKAKASPAAGKKGAKKQAAIK